MITLIILSPLIAVIAIIYLVFPLTIYFPVVTIFWIITHCFVYLFLLIAGKRSQFRFRSSPAEIIQPAGGGFSLKSLFSKNGQA